MRIQARAFVLLAVPFVLAFPKVAVGLCPPVPGAALLAFGATYEEGGRTQTHRGLDLACAAGDEVVAPCTGNVTFAGMVPGAGGEAVLAVTVVAADGLKVTLLPLERAVVAVGDTVSEGTSLGEVASAGDVSCDSPHVHLSARRGDLYVDPAPLLASATAEAPVSEPGAVSGDPAPPVTVSGVQAPRPAAAVAVTGGRAASTRKASGPAEPVPSPDRAQVRVRAGQAGVGQGVARPSPTAQVSEPVEKVRCGRQRSGVASDGTAWILAAAAGACALCGVALKGTAAPARLRESGAA